MTSKTNLRFVGVATVLCFFIVAYVVYFDYEVRSLLIGVSFHRYWSTNNTIPQTRQNPSCEARFIDSKLLDYIAFYVRDKPYPGIDNYTNYIAMRSRASPFAVDPINLNDTPVYNDVKSFTYSTQLRPCEKPLNQTSLFVAIISAPQNIDKRNAIRETWLKQLNTELNAIRKPNDTATAVSVGAAFIIGQSETDITEEAAKFNDIIQVDMSDAYFNLSIKVAGLLNWIDEKCSFVDFLLKVDDDVYANVRNLGSFLRQVSPSEANIYGIYGNINVARSGKWGMRYEDYPWGTYPAFFLGPTVLMTHATLRPLLAAMQTIPYYPIDDVYLSGMCREKAGANLMFANRLLAMTGARPFEACWMRDYITFLRGGPDQIINVHNISEGLYVNNNTQCFRTNDSLAEDPFKVFEFPVKRLV